MRNNFRSLPVIGAIGLAALFAAGAKADPIYSLVTTIAVPADEANSVGGNFTSFDISWFDAGTQLDYVADRSNASVDIFSAATNSFVGRVGGFVGIQPGTNTSGPNGVLTIDLPSQHSLWAGDGNSTLLGFDLNAGNAPLPNTPIATGIPANARADEMAFAPISKRLVVANDAASTPYVTIIDTASDKITHKIFFDGVTAPLATNGLEQPVWNPNTKLFYISVPQVNGTGPGAIAAFDPDSGKMIATFDLAALGIGGCGPTGLAMGSGNQMMIGCGDAGTKALLFDPTANGGKGGIVKSFDVSGSDEVWYDPTTKRFFVSGSNDPNGPRLAVIDGTSDILIQDIATVAGSHSVAVDDVSSEIFVPYRAGNGICPNGCIAVFGEVSAVPEPRSLAMLATGLMLLAGAGLRRRLH
jgi:hypothetical protein